jgi:hypothetical protein
MTLPRITPTPNGTQGFPPPCPPAMAGVDMLKATSKPARTFFIKTFQYYSAKTTEK